MFNKLFELIFGKQEPSNWREAFQQAHGIKGKSMHDEVINRRSKYIDEAKKMAFIDVQKLKIVQRIPIDVLKKLSDKAVCQLGRGVVSRADIETYFPDVKKGELQYIAASISNTARTVWDILETKNIVRYKYYVWKGYACKTHNHLNGVIFSFDTPAPLHMSKDDSVTGTIHAGQGYRCLCYMEALISEHQIKSPVMFFDGEKIKRITKKEALKLISK